MFGSVTFFSINFRGDDFGVCESLIGINNETVGNMAPTQRGGEMQYRPVAMGNKWQPKY